MPVSDKQLAANRANAAKSTGPKTIGGKYNSSRNATTHGFLAGAILIPGESRERFFELLGSLITEFEPATPNELALVETMAVSRWRLLRLWTIETAGIVHEEHLQANSTTDEDSPTRAMLALRSLAQHSNSQESLSRHEVRFDRQYHRAADRLIRLREARRPPVSVARDSKKARRPPVSVARELSYRPINEEKQQRSQFSAENKEPTE